MGQLASTHQRFEAALHELIDEIREDKNILAAILCGSLSHDEVWDKSDIDLVLVCIDDRKIEPKGIALVKDDINIHTSIIPRLRFRADLESATRNTIDHSMYAKATLLFSNDPSINQLFADLSSAGARDRQIQQMLAGSRALYNLYKAQKWFEVKNDLNYTTVWLLNAAANLAQIELGAAGQIVAREVLPEALALNPQLFTPIYVDLVNKRKTRKAVGEAVALIHNYLRTRTESLFAPVLEYLANSGDPRSGTEIHAWFERNHNFHESLIVCEWLSDMGFVEKASTPVKLTVKSRVDVEEVAYYHVGF